MADFHKVLKADPLGEPWTPNKPGAKAIQNYWCQVEGQEWAVSIGRQVDNPLRPGMHVYGDLMYTKSQKGTEYWKFKGAKVPDDVQRPTDDPSSPAQATAQQSTGAQPNASGTMPGWMIPIANQIDYIYKEMKQMNAEAPEEAPATGVEHVGGEPISEEEQTRLDDIFGPGPEIPEDE